MFINILTVYFCFLKLCYYHINNLIIYETTRKTAVKPSKYKDIN